MKILGLLGYVMTLGGAVLLAMTVHDFSEALMLVAGVGLYDAGQLLLGRRP